MRCLVLCLLLATLATAQDRKPIVPKGANPAGPYTPGILAGGTLYVAGQVGRDQAGKYPVEFEAEVKQCLANVANVLAAANMDFSRAVTVTVYLTDMQMFDRMNKVYMETFPEPRPARTTVGVAKLVGDARIEITVTAH